MNRKYFVNLESGNFAAPLPIEEVIEQLAFNELGLVCVITQDVHSKVVLMHVWMNKAALQLTISSRRMTYWSRSRGKLWIKGETSGNIQQLVSMAFDCDGDAILCQVSQTGGACHTGRNDCFYLNVDVDKGWVTIMGE